MIDFEHVYKTYETHNDENVALEDINIHIDEGEFVFILGHSGAGKSTFLKLIQMEEKPTEGKVFINGQDLTRIKRRKVPYLRRQMGVVFQDFRLIPTMTVYENVAFAMRVTNISTKKIKDRVPFALSLVGLEDKMDRLPDELSGGEQQRVAIARAYVNHPQILLADEPTGNLDPTTSLGIMEVLDAINRTGTTVVMATHNEEIVNSMRKRVVELHSGRIVRDEEHGSYDSAVFFPDSEVTSKSHRALRSNGGGMLDDEPHTVMDAMQAGAIAAHAMDGGDGIARLAQSVHSGRTGRYGEAFASPEDTMTWGKGLPLDEMAQRESHDESYDETGSATGDEAFMPPVPPAPPVSPSSSIPPTPPTPPAPPAIAERGIRTDNEEEQR